MVNLLALLLLPQRYIFSSKSQLRSVIELSGESCCCYHKGTYFQANHNGSTCDSFRGFVVVATTKVHIFKQITTLTIDDLKRYRLLLLPQRYIFSSKSQLKHYRVFYDRCCCCYHKGTYFQANHNKNIDLGIQSKLLLLPQRYIFSSKSQLRMIKMLLTLVVVATTKVHIFKQITTEQADEIKKDSLLLLPQRYIFSSKSQLEGGEVDGIPGCYCYHKDTYFQANHNLIFNIYLVSPCLYLYGIYTVTIEEMQRKV